MVSDESRRWIDAWKRVGEGERNGIRCPRNDDDFLILEWVQGKVPDSPVGEWWLHCPTCGAQSFMRVASEPD